MAACDLWATGYHIATACLPAFSCFLPYCLALEAVKMVIPPASLSTCFLYPHWLAALDIKLLCLLGYLST